MNRRNFLKSALSGIGIASVWAELQTTDADTGSKTDAEFPYTVDRFQPQTGYNYMVSGRIGGGKTYSPTIKTLETKLEEDGQHILIDVDEPS